MPFNKLPRWVGHSNDDIGHLKGLLEIDGQVHSIVFETSGDSGRLPPGISISIHCIWTRMRFVGACVWGITYITNLEKKVLKKLSRTDMVDIVETISSNLERIF